MLLLVKNTIITQNFDVIILKTCQVLKFYIHLLTLYIVYIDIEKIDI